MHHGHGLEKEKVDSSAKVTKAKAKNGKNMKFDPEFTCVPLSFLSKMKQMLTFDANRPTCTQIFRVKWQSVSLSWRFRIFRAKRRVWGRKGD